MLVPRFLGVFFFQTMFLKKISQNYDVLDSYVFVFVYALFTFYLVLYFVEGF